MQDPQQFCSEQQPPSKETPPPPTSSYGFLQRGEGAQTWSAGGNMMPHPPSTPQGVGTQSTGQGQYDNLQPLCPKFLEIIKWIPDGENTEEKLKVVESLAPKWEKVAAIFNMNRDQIKAIQNPGSGMSPEQCLSEVLARWEKNGDKDYPYTWDGLRTLLVDLECKAVAEQLGVALVSQRSNVGGNLLHPQQTRIGKDKDMDERPSYFLAYAAATDKFLNLIFGMIVIIVLATLLLAGLVYRDELMHGYNLRTHSKSLPHLSINFVGRENEIQEILEKLNFASTKTQIVSIVGSPGFGKSTLAIHVAHALVDQKVQVHHVNLDEFPDDRVDLILAEKILKSSDITAKTLTFERLLQWVKDRYGYTLFVLDNCDNVLNTQKERFQSVILRIVQASTTIKVIMTSRETALQIEYYFLYKVDELSSKAAISLLDQKLFPKINIPLNIKEEIAVLTGNVPLALHIVGLLLTLEDPPSPETVINELESNPMSLLSPKELPIEQRINASISLSYGYLNKNQKNVAHFLALFPGSFNKDAAIKISQKYESVDGSILHLSHSKLRMLVDRSLLEYNDRTKRYQYHRLIHEYLLAVNNEFQQRIYRKHFYSSFRKYFLNLLNKHARNFDQHYVDSLQFLDTERHNIYDLLQILNKPSSVPRRLLLDAVELVTLAIDNGYLTCRYSYHELIYFLEDTVFFLDDHIQSFCERASYNNIDKKISQKVYYERIYVKLIISFSNILASVYGDQHAISFMEERQSVIDSLEPPLQLIRNNFIDPANLNTVQMSQRRAFYIHLARRYFILEQHSKVIACQLKIMEDAQKFCEKEKCSDKEIGYMHSYKEIGCMYSSNRFDNEAIKFLELSLKYEKNDALLEVEILLELFELYKRKNSEEELMKATSQLINSCHTLIQMNDEVIFNHWETVLKAIVFIDQAGIDGQFLEERLFSIVSNPGTDIQLEPKDAANMLAAIEHFNNHTKTILWGTVMLKPFQNYKLSLQFFYVLKINASISLARFKNLEIFEGLDGLEQVFNALDALTIRIKVGVAEELYKMICPPLILRPKHIYPCYKNSIENFFISFFYSLPVTLGNLLFAVPFDFYNTDHKLIDQGLFMKRHYLSNALLTTSSEEFELQKFKEYISVIGTNALKNMWYSYFPQNTNVYIKLNNLTRLLLNVLSVFVRFWIFATILLPASMSLFVRFSSQYLKSTLAPRYFAFTLNPESLSLIRYVISLICDVLINSHIIQGKYLQNILVYPWLVIIDSNENFTQISVDEEHYRSRYKGYCFSQLARLQFWIFCLLLALLVFICTLIMWLVQINYVIFFIMYFGITFINVFISSITWLFNNICFIL